MPDYQRMYTVLCVAADGALQMLPSTEENAAVRLLLQAALLQAEDIYKETAEASGQPGTEKERV